MPLLKTDTVRIFDPIYLARLHHLVRHPLFQAGAVEEEFRRAVESLEIPAWRAPGGATGPDGLETTALLVLRGPALWNELPTFGTPMTLRVVAFGRGHGPPEQLTWRNRLASEPGIQSLAHQAMKAVLTHLGADRAALSYQIEIPETNESLGGGSIGVALALLINAFESAERGQAVLVPRPGIAFVGGVEADGRVRSLAPASLDPKLRAAAGAGLRGVAVPLDQVERANATLDDPLLRSVTPNRPKIRGVEHFAELLADPEFVEATARRTVRSRVHHRPSRWPLLAGGLALLALLAGWAWSLRPWSATRTVVEYDHQSPIVHARDAGFPSRTRSWDVRGNVSWARSVAFGPREPARLLVTTESSGEAPGHLYCFDLRGGGLVWSRDYSGRFFLSDSIRASTMLCVDSSHLVLDLDGDGVDDWLASMHLNPISPWFVVWFDSRGRERNFLAHRGYLSRMASADLDGDGLPEVLLGGIHNTDASPFSQEATLVAVNRDHFSAWPAEGAFVGAGRVAFDSTLVEVLFPPIPEYCDLADSPGWAVAAIEIHGSPRSPTIQLYLNASGMAGYIVTLDSRFELTGMIAEDDLQAAVEHAVRDGRISRNITSNEFIAGYRREIRWRHVDRDWRAARR